MTYPGFVKFNNGWEQGVPFRVTWGLKKKKKMETDFDLFGLKALYCVATSLSYLTARLSHGT